MNEDPTPSTSLKALGDLAPIHFSEGPKALCNSEPSRLPLLLPGTQFLASYPLYPDNLCSSIEFSNVTTSPGKSSLTSDTGRLSYSMFSPLVMVCNNMLCVMSIFQNTLETPLRAGTSSVSVTIYFIRQDAPHH